ncbi:hypothetical protein RND71_036143 [Anisodus tanguticus]|uniref:TFIIB-type domain-containing protein n=1 Tax=Anisodus tanguticus TaxID=243964 RepID=A0AAE1UWG5_9SOLA|nr:hypothetical protein RND71_036143 [Anisodus tanguticus]
MGDSYCSDCKRNTEVVFDHAAGDTVCSECGLVLESRSIDETSEWRTFADESGDHDPNRVGGPVNPLLGDVGLSTVISKGPNGSNGDSSLARLQNRGGDPERALVMAFKVIATMADRLSLVSTIKVPYCYLLPSSLEFSACLKKMTLHHNVMISAHAYYDLACDILNHIAKDRASEIYKRLEDQKCTRGRNLDALVAACIYIACRQEGKARTVKEICSIANGATKKEIGRAKEFIVKQLKVEMGESMEMGTIHAGDYLRRFCSNIGMNHEEIKAVQETVKKSEEFDIRRSPISIAAAIIYMLTQLTDSKKPLRDISIATTVAEGTIKNAYKDLYPHASKIIPEWYLKGKDLKSLCSPKA